MYPLDGGVTLQVSHRLLLNEHHDIARQFGSLIQLCEYA